MYLRHKYRKFSWWNKIKTIPRRLVTIIFLSYTTISNAIREKQHFYHQHLIWHNFGLFYLSDKSTMDPSPQSNIYLVLKNKFFHKNPFFFRNFCPIIKSWFSVLSTIFFKRIILFSMEQQLSGSDKDNKKLSNMIFYTSFLTNKPTVGPPKYSSNSLGCVLNLLVCNKIFCLFIRFTICSRGFSPFLTNFLN